MDGTWKVITCHHLCLSHFPGNRPTHPPPRPQPGHLSTHLGRKGRCCPCVKPILTMQLPASKQSLAFFFSPSNYLNGVLAPFSLKQDITFIDIVAAATSVKLTERRSWPILMMDLVLSSLQHNLSWGKRKPVASRKFLNPCKEEDHIPLSLIMSISVSALG